MKVQLASGGSSSSAASLIDMVFTQCADGAYVLTNTEHPGTSDTTSAFRRTTVDADHSADKSGNVRVLVRVRVKVPLSFVNVNGIISTAVPELQVHMVLNVPKVMVSALQGTLATPERDDQYAISVTDAQTVAQNAVAEALAVLATIATNQPVNFTSVSSGLFASPFFKGLMGVCPVEYQSGDYGSVRVLPPPARS